jgi:hypothetical protein
MRRPPGRWRARRSRRFLDSLYAEGAFAGRSGETSYFVGVRRAHQHRRTMRAGKFNLAFGFAASKPGEYHAFLVTHSRRLAHAADHRESLRELFAERGLRIESSILRGLVPCDPRSRARGRR